jgi:hypothetical protein
VKVSSSETRRIVFLYLNIFQKVTYCMRIREFCSVQIFFLNDMGLNIKRIFLVISSEKNAFS